MTSWWIRTWRICHEASWQFGSHPDQALCWERPRRHTCKHWRRPVVYLSVVNSPETDAIGRNCADGAERQNPRSYGVFIEDSTGMLRWLIVVIGWCWLMALLCVLVSMLRRERHFRTIAIGFLLASLGLGISIAAGIPGRKSINEEGRVVRSIFGKPEPRNSEGRR